LPPYIMSSFGNNRVEISISATIDSVMLVQYKSRSSSASTVTRLRAGRPWSHFRQRLEFFSSPRRSGHLGPTKLPTQLEPGVKRPERESDHSFLYSADVKNLWSYTCTPPVRLHGVVLRLPIDISSLHNTLLSRGTAISLT